MSEGSVFVTVGTTSFDRLIKTITTDSILKELNRKGYNKMLLQIGAGATEPNKQNSIMEMDYFRYRPDLNDVINSSDLIISHAGAGSILESLEAKKPLIVVVNEELMNNHQTELARQLSSDGYLVYCNCATLQDTIHSFDSSSLKPYVPGDPSKFIRFVDKVMNYS